MFERSRTRTAASSETARRRLELLGSSLSGELAPDATGPAGDVPVGVPVVPDAPAPAGRHAARPVPRSERLVAGVGDRVPVGVRAAWTSRLTGQHLAVLAIVVAMALCVAAWWALSARPEVQAAPQLSPPSAVTPPGGPTEAATTGSAPASTAAPPEDDAGGPVTGGDTEQVGPGQVVVDVAGRVRDPGIVTLPPGSRVVDALEAAGGPRGDVDLSTLNLARVLVDGEQLLVGVEPAVPPPASAPTGSPEDPAAGATPVALNTATLAELETLPGVGPVTAQAILDWRTEHGGFTSVDELLEVSGIGEVTLEELRPLVTV
jgi:competence protein ComEA